VLIVGLGACGGSPTAPDVSQYVVNGSYTFGCGNWGLRGVPPVERALLDIGVNGSQDHPDASAVAALEAAGGQTVYRFHGAFVRMAINVRQVQPLGMWPADPPSLIVWARTVSDPSSHVVDLTVRLDHPGPTDEELRAIADAGGTPSFVFSSSAYLGVRVDDPRIPAIAALPHVVSTAIQPAFFCSQ
jgi:hypothetical protein